MRYILLIAALLQISCSKKNELSGDPSCGCVAPPEPVEAQVANISGKIQKCLGADAPLLNSGYDLLVFNQSGLEKEISANADSYENLARMYKIKKLTVDSNLFQVCLDSINKLSCDSAIIKNIIDDEGIVHLENIHQFLRADTSCKSVYSIVP